MRDPTRLYKYNRGVQELYAKLRMAQGDDRAELQRAAKRAAAQAATERGRLATELAAVEDPVVREILVLRYLHFCSWTQIACIVGGNNTADGVRMIAKRYITGH